MLCFSYLFHIFSTTGVWHLGLRYLFTLLLLASTACSQRKAPKVYVALGDSYAAGFGAGTDLKPDDGCRRHALSYPRQFFYADPNNMPDRFYDFSCGDKPADSILKQIDRIPEDAELISLTWGAEFVKIPGAVYFCDEYFSSSYCSFVLGDVEKRTYSNNVVDSYNRVLPRLIQNIRNKAPDAMIVLLGYPRFYGSPVKDCVIHKGSPGSWYQTYKDRLNNIPLLLNLGMLEVTFANVDTVKYRSPDPDFTFHRYCDASGSRWFIPWQQWLKTYDGWSGYGYFHPTVQGQQVYKTLLLEAWNSQ